MARRKLEIDTLEVESFETAAPDRVRGTVRAHESFTEGSCFQCTNYNSCGWSEIDCYTEGCRTDWNTCGAYGSCCPAICQ